MPWPNSSRATGYVVTAANWNEVAAALSTWGGDVNGAGGTLSNVAAVSATGVITGKTVKRTYQQVIGAATITPEITNGIIEIDLDRATTTLAAPTYNGSGILPSGVKFVLKLKHSLASSDVSWNAVYKGVSGFALSGVNGQYNVFEFVSRPDGNVELVTPPLIGVTN